MNDIRTEGGGGKEIGQRARGSKNHKLLRTSYMEALFLGPSSSSNVMRASTVHDAL